MLTFFVIFSTFLTVVLFILFKFHYTKGSSAFASKHTLRATRHYHRNERGVRTANTPRRIFNSTGPFTCNRLNSNHVEVRVCCRNGLLLHSPVRLVVCDLGDHHYVQCLTLIFFFGFAMMLNALNS